MTDNINKLAWFAAALAILAWAFVPHLAAAHPVYFPPVPKVDTMELPPFGTGTPAEDDGPDD